MSVVAELVHRMVTDVFSERDAHRRVEAIAAVFADNVVFVDPEGTVTGQDRPSEWSWRPRLGPGQALPYTGYSNGSSNNISRAPATAK